eukprot:TRINITY_DN9659_c0_g1_i1.p1 TRINITY_DN9659_c0_g1~~TRINITY_DN9659_c0_g1_i1.p1  ORF type:complete len:1097 (+),score=334.31 TRINITY_DN9659_c0_g1_i1:34-3291(+)
MATFARPENALKRAEELMNVGQKQAALQALHDLITSKRYRTWQKTLEKIMFKYVELCVDMRKGRYAKDGLIQYRIVCQQVNVSSLEEVIKYFMKLATEKAEEAQKQTEAAVTSIEVKDLEEDQTPEDLMLSFVSGEKGKERQDKELVTPWFKFLWETYRTVLEILRNNSKLETLYAMTAHRAFQFCVTYKRSTEFRRLCEILRNHLANLNKYRDQRDRPDLTQPESLQLYLDTRFDQLKVATDLSLWQEAFRSIEDIHGLMSLVKKSPKPQMMAIYYAKLTKIFWMSGDSQQLYHAYAWYKLYNLQRSYNKNLKEKDLQLMAASVLLATLSIPPYDKKYGAHHYELEVEKERNIRMANLLGFTLSDPKRGESREVLSRSALLQELLSKGVLSYVPAEVKELYQLLETEFHPLDLAKRAQPLLAKLADLSDKLSGAAPVPDVMLEQYVPSLEKLTTLRLLHQVSQVYETMRLRDLSHMVPFGGPPYLEKLVVDAVKYNYVHVRINHQDKTVHFGSQALESDKVRNHLVLLARRLSKAVGLISSSKGGPAPAPAVTVSAAEREHHNLLLEKEHQRLLARKILIERRKEEAEKEIIEKEREERTILVTRQKQTEEAETRRLQAEQARRLEERIRKELEEKERAEALALLEEKNKRDSKKKGKKGAVDVADTSKLDKQALLQAAMEEQMKEKAELERKVQKAGRQMDHLERARREEERPLIEAAFKQRLAEDEENHRKQQEALLEQSKAQHALDLTEKHRLSRMLDDKAIFQEQVISRRRGEFERLRREREEKLAKLRAVKHAERIQLRKREMVRRKEEARVRKEMEIEAARKKEEEERKKEEAAERLRKLDEIAAKTRQRELEAEEKMKKEKAEAIKKAEEARSSKFVPPSMRGGAGARGGTGEMPPSERSNDGWRSSRADDRSERDRDSRAPPSREPPSEARAPPSRPSEPSTAPVKGGYVPPSRRGGAAQESASSGGGNAPPPSREPYRPPASSTSGRFVPSVRAGGDRPSERPSYDRERPSDRFGGAGSRGGSSGPPARGGEDRWGGGSGGARPEERAAPPARDPPSAAPPASSDGKWRPKSRQT